jgi:hypothetical protein
VDFPEPDAPVSARNPPGSMVRVTSSAAVTGKAPPVPYRLLTPRNSIAPRAGLGSGQTYLVTM